MQHEGKSGGRKKANKNVNFTFQLVISLIYKGKILKIGENKNNVKTVILGILLRSQKHDLFLLPDLFLYLSNFNHFTF